MSGHQLLTAENHRDLRIRTDRAVELGDGVMSCVTMPYEFRQVQDEYPILFRLNQERDRFTALALFGFQNGENLFLRDGRWDARYVPLAHDIQPFLIGGAPEDTAAKQVHVDMDSPRIGGEEGVRAFDPDGRPTPFLDAVAEKLGALDEGYRASADFFAALRRYDLLEPLTLEITLADHSTNRLVGFHVIDEDRLRNLDGGAVAELHAEGHLMPIFMALASLSKIGALVARKNRDIGHG